jgi:predicted nucleotidyltransferase
MISENDRMKIVKIGKRFGASKIFLFGSSTTPGDGGRDIDLAVRGVGASRFFEFYGELIFGLSKPVDLVDLGKESKFTKMILSEGVLLYG